MKDPVLHPLGVGCRFAREQSRLRLMHNSRNCLELTKTFFRSKPYPTGYQIDNQESLYQLCVGCRLAIVLCRLRLIYSQDSILNYFHLFKTEFSNVHTT